MKILISLFFLSFVVFACDQVKTAQNTDAKVQTPKEKVVANKMLTFEIQGMSCEMMCGGSIRQELSETNAVEKCEFDFEDDRRTNIVAVSYDQKKTTAKELIKIVTKMNEGQFKVGKSDEHDISINIKATIKDLPAPVIEDTKS